MLKKGGFMDNQAIRNFLNMQMDAADRAKDSQESGLLLLLMADYLLEAVQKQPDVFSGADTGQLRRMFLRCGSAGERLRGFYAQYHEPISETSARLLQKIGQNMQLIEQQHQKTLQLGEAIQQAEETEQRLREENQELLSRDKELTERRERFADLERTVAEYRRILEEITPETLKQLEKEEKELDREQEERTAKRDRLSAELKVLEGRLLEIQEEAERLSEEKDRTEARERELREQIERDKKEIQRQNARNTEFEADAAELSRQISEAGEAYEELRAYLKESERIEESILAEGYFDKQSFLDKLHGVKRQGQELSSTYSQLLGEILEDAKALYDKIRERQKKK